MVLRQLVRSLTLAMMLAISGAVPPAAEALTGLELLRQCEGRSPQGLEALGPILCMAYLSGILDGYQVRTMEAGVGRQALCPPTSGIENEQTKLIVEKWLRDHPGDLGEVARVPVVVALAQAFPCRR